MNIVTTKSFQLATYSAGDLHSNNLALVLPGKLDTKDYTHMKSHVNYLATLGYLAVSFDPPGTWESPGNISLYTVTNYLQAVHELIEYYGNRKTFLMGHSRGATIAILAGAANPYVTSFASIMSTFTKNGFANKTNAAWKKMGYKLSMRDLPPGGGPKEKRFELPYGFLEDQRIYKLTDEILHSKKPKLFFLGRDDALISPENVRKTYALFDEPKELHELDSPHRYRFNEKILEEINIITKTFLTKYENWK